MTVWRKDERKGWKGSWLLEMITAAMSGTQKVWSSVHFRTPIITALVISVLFIYELSFLQEGVAQQDDYHVVWANLHSHTALSDNLEKLPDPFRFVTPSYAIQRSKEKLNVLAITDHAEQLRNAFDIVNSTGTGSQRIVWYPWEYLKQQVEESNNNNFVTLYGFEWTGDKAEDARGHINVIGFPQSYAYQYDKERYLSPLAPPISVETMSATIVRDSKYGTKAETLKDFYQWINKNVGDDFVCQFNHPNLYADSPFNNFIPDSLSDDARKKFALFEIGYHAMRQIILEPKPFFFEHTFVDGDDIGIKILTTEWDIFHPTNRIISTSNEGIFIRALDAGWHLAPVHNEDNHLHYFGGEPQKTGIWIRGNLDRRSVMEALRARRVFATETRDFVVRLNARSSGETGWHWMGERFEAQGDKITFWVSMSYPKGLNLKSIHLITNTGKSYQLWPQGLIDIKEGGPEKEIFAFTYTRTLNDGLPLTKLNKEKYYFLKIVRIKEKDDDLIYTAPVWVKPPAGSEPPPTLGRIAVTPPGFDDIGAVLTQMGIPFTQISDEQVRDFNVLHQFDVLFLNCSSRARDNAQSAADALRRFVEMGGRVYASDWAFAYLYYAFPNMIQFFGSPESEDAYIGVDGTVTAEVVEPGLREALGMSEVDLDYDLGWWVPIKDVAEGITVYLRGNYPASRVALENRMALHHKDRRKVSSMTNRARVSRTGPLAVGFNYGQGFVIFTTFHNAPQRTEIEVKLLRFLALRPAIEPFVIRNETILIEDGYQNIMQIVDTINQGEQSPKFTVKSKGNQSLRFVLNWPESTLRLSVFKPNGQVFAEKESSWPPIVISVPDAEAGKWSYQVTAVDIPTDNYPYVISVGVQDSLVSELPEGINFVSFPIQASYGDPIKAIRVPNVAIARWVKATEDAQPTYH